MHKHHIIPKHAGGTNDPSNLIELTVEQHAEAHKKLYEEHGRWQDKLAWETLSGIITKEEAIRISQSMGGKMTKGRVAWNKGKQGIFNSDALEKISKANKNKPKSEEFKQRIIESNKTRILSGDTKRKMGAKNIGKKITEETRQKLKNRIPWNKGLKLNDK